MASRSLSSIANQGAAAASSRHPYNAARVVLADRARGIRYRHIHASPSDSGHPGAFAMADPNPLAGMPLAESLANNMNESLQWMTRLWGAPLRQYRMN